GHNASIISYEEYYPYGSTSYQAGPSAAEVSLKRYRYTGKERDDETGFYYYGARYYAPWVGRWTSCDPAGIVDGASLYPYARNSPIKLNDPSGGQSDDPEIKSTKIGNVWEIPEVTILGTVPSSSVKADTTSAAEQGEYLQYSYASDATGKIAPS